MISSKRKVALKNVRLVTPEPSKKIVSVRMSDTIINHIKHAMEQEGLGSRKRSAWISQALLMLEDEFAQISTEDQCLFLRQSQSVSGQGSSVPITLNAGAQTALAARLAFCEHHIPDVLDAQSRIIHLSITLRCIKLGLKLA